MTYDRNVRWWEPRRENESTTEYLGRVLEAALMPGFAARARRGDYDDYFCTLEEDCGDNMIRLVSDLNDAAYLHHSRNHREKIYAIRQAVRDGEFDGTRQESERWFASKDGQDAMNLLMGMGLVDGDPR